MNRLIGVLRKRGGVFSWSLVVLSLGMVELSMAEELVEGVKGEEGPSVEEVRAKAKEAAEKITQEEEDEAAGKKGGGIGAQIGSIIPQGAPAKNVTIPSFEEGVLSSLTEADLVTFVGDSKEDLEMVGMTIQLFDGEGAVDLVIEL
jgi:hypothetical protein